jgi:hypothetical protein
MAAAFSILLFAETGDWIFALLLRRAFATFEGYLGSPRLARNQRALPALSSF